ncbi:TetR family transcriptional regulator [Kribbella solani]|uniref:TetR family transcriptional regulator n=1 Tax=Kribbella solani TaxID=236067 RepID=UPI0029BC40A1|nr:TetR family transcriptional regulator [Kribbella solani]MDX3003888.1 TetR family transcriptional regulator [Kribbella solani]
MTKPIPRAESQARTRERLLAAAAELFAERGVHGASVEQIAERAGYTRGAFYGNFAGKPELVAALLDERTQREYAEIVAIGAGPDPVAALRDWHRRRTANESGWLTLRLELLLYAVRSGGADQDAIDHGLLTAGDLLDQRGLPHDRLRATATCLEDIKIPHRKRAGKISTT